MKLEMISSANLDGQSNQELLQFFSSFHIQGLMELKYDRKSDFFGLYKTQGKDFRTYFLRDQPSGKIAASASFVIREVRYANETVKIAYATDLRVSNSRRAILEWSQHFLPTLEAIKADLKVNHFFSVIDMGERTILNAFLRPRTMRRNLPRYFLYRKFNINSLHGRFPWAPTPLQSLRIREGNSSNLEALVDYLTRKSKYRPFCSVWDQNSLEQKISRLPGFKLSDFLIAFDNQEKVIGCLAPWSPQSVQKLIPFSFDGPADNFRQFLKFGRLFGWTHPLTKPVSSSGTEAPLNFRWLSHLAVDNEDIFESLLWKAYERLNRQEFLAYTQIDQDFRINPPKSWIAAQQPHALYSMTAPAEDRPSYVHPSETLNPEIEGIFI